MPDFCGSDDTKPCAELVLISSYLPHSRVSLWRGILVHGLIVSSSFSDIILEAASKVRVGIGHMQGLTLKVDRTMKMKARNTSGSRIDETAHERLAAHPAQILIANSAFAKKYVALANH